MKRAQFLTLAGVTLGIVFSSIPPAHAQQQPLPVQPASSASQNSSTAPATTTRQQRADLVRKRAEWFQKQRAYPFTHIPSGALQQAIEQRNAMIQQKRSGRVLAAPPLINFPGNGLWQLTGPQPTNVPSFPGLGNVGFPTVSGRVTALAVDTSDTTGNTIYLGAAAGGVWKTTNGGTSWTPLTDSQPSLAVGSIAIDPNNHNTIYVGTGEDNFNLDGYYGVGVLKSTDGGATWTQLGASVFSGAKSPNLGGAKIGAIAVQPGNSNVVLASVDFFDGNDPSGGVYQSLDGGVTWNRPAAGAQGAAGTDLVFDPTSVAANNAATVYAALGDIFSPSAASNGIWKSTDSGAHWTKLAGGLPSTNVGRITLGYAHSTSGATATIYAAIADASTNSGLLLGFFVTTNGGTTWTKLTNTPDFCVEPGGLDGQCFYDLTVAVHPANANFVVLGGGAYLDNSTTLFKSTDGGVTWSTDSTTASTDFTIGSTNVRPHVDTHALAFAPNGATPRLYTGDDGGVWRTDDPTPANPLWVDLNATLAIAQFYPGAMPSVSDENYGFGGTQDNDVQAFSGALGWTMAPACGDGGYTAVDTTTPTTIYAGCNAFAGAKVTKSVFNGLFTPGPIPTPAPSFVPAETEITASHDTMGFIPPLVIDPQSTSTLYFGTCRIWETTSGGVSQFGSPAWSPITGDLTNGNASVAACATADEITTIDVSQQTFGLLLAGTSNGKVWQASFGFPTEIDNGLLPNRHITAVRSKSSDTTGNIAYVTFSGFGSCAGCGSTPGHVFKTKNATQGPLATWTNISGNLPDVPVNDIIVDHQNAPTSDALYIATDVGVFSCPDPEAATPCTNWTVVGDGLPNSPVLSLAMRPTSRILRAATHGRSMWDIQLTDAAPPSLPTLGSMTPAAVMAGSPTTTVTVTGVNFGTNTKVAVGTGPFAFIPTGLTTTFVSTTQLTVSVPSTLLTDGTVVNIGLTDPLGTSTSTLPFTVMNPIPDITGVTSSISPGIVAEPVTFTLTGTGFVNGTELTINGFENFGTASNNGKTLTVVVSGSELTAPVASPGAPVTVFNPTPGGGQAAESFKFVINANGTPEIIFTPSFVSFPALNAGGTSAVMNVQLINCVVQTTPGVCGTSGGAALILSAGSATKSGTNAGDFSVVTPTSGSPICAFAPTGTATSVAPGASCFFGVTFTPIGTLQGSRFATLTVSDDDADGEPSLFLEGEVNGPIASVSPNPIAFGSVPKGITPLPLINVTVFNFGSGTPALAVTSVSILSSANSADFAIAAPTNGGAACSPSAGPFTLASFVSCSFGITFNPSLINVQETATLEFTFSNGTVAKIDIPMSGTGVVPTIDSISPEIVATGGPTFALTVNGRNYVLGSVVNLNGNARLTTFVSATQLQASIPASDLTTAGSSAITVTNPAGGGTSEPKSLIVAQAPTGTNDDFADATTVITTPTPFQITQDTTKFTTNTGGHADPAPACAPGAATLSGKARSAWFKFVAPASGRVVADTRFSSYNTILSVWTGAPGSFVAVACNNAGIPGATPESFAGFNVTNGTTYFLMVTDASASGAGGTLTFRLDFASVAPANDDWANATVVPPASTPFSNSVNTILATINTGGHADPTPLCAPTGAANGGIANSVWYSFTPTSGTPVTADTLTSLDDTILSVWTGTPGAFTQVACNDNAGTGPTQVLQSQVSFTATASTTYYFMISSVLGDGGTAFHLNLTSLGPAASVVVAPNPVSFGNQKQGTTSAASTITVTNSGTLNATLTAGTPVTITGTNPGDFAIATGTTCVASFVLTANGGSCVIKVTFTPAAAGARTATVNVADDGPGSPQQTTLNGTGVLANVGVAPNPVPFGNQTLGTTSGASTITVTNSGNLASTLTAGAPVTITGTNPGDFAIATGTTCVASFVLTASGGSCVIKVTFTPGAAGARTATVNVADDGPGSPQQTTLNGTGVVSNVILAPNPVPFGNQKQGTTSAASTITVTNNGTLNATLTAGTPVTITGTNPGDFAIATGTTCVASFVLTASGGSCVIKVTFTPGAAGARTATVNVADDAPANPQQTTLNGTGVLANVGVAPNPVPFGNQKQGTTSAASTITVTNSGTLNATLTAGTPVTITGTNPGDFAIATGTTCVASFVLTASGGSCVIKVTFTPGAAGARTATVNVADDGPGSPQQTTLNGTGVLANVGVAPNPVPFGNQKQGTTSAASTITVTNSGTLNATLTAGTPVTITGTNPGDFAIATGTTCVASFVLTANGGSCVIKVTFTPAAAGARTATVNVADDGPGSPQQTTLNGTGVLANVGVAPNPVPFGNQTLGTTSGASTITVTNSGNLASTLTAGTPVTITGTNPGDFAIATGTTCVASFVLTASGGSCVIKVTFTPGAAGARTATVNVADDGPGSPQQTTLNGTGVVSNVILAPNPVPFGNQKQGTTSAASTITVTNNGTLNATLTAGTPVTITGTNPGDFAIATGTTCVASFVLTASGGSCVIKVTFTPGAAGARTATVNVADDAPANPQQTTLNGTGVLANVGVAPNPVPFGNQKQGTTSAASTITVTNSGTLNATLTAGTPVTITGTNPGDFAIATGTTCVASFVLTASGGSCVIKVTFTPGAAGARTATVNVADDGPGSPQQTTLNGTGVLANVGVAPNPVPFGNQKQGTTSAASTITVTNSGTLNATLTAGTPVTITGTNPGDFAIATGTTCVASFVLTANGGSCVIKVTFTPAAAGARTATVNVADDGPGSPQQTTLNGTGVLANVGVAPNPVPFGNQTLGTTSGASTITVTNSGNLASTLTAGTPVTITGTNPGDFAIATGTTCVASFVLTASGGSCVIKVTFTPGAAGARTATVNVADDGPGSPQQTTLNGTGVVSNVILAPNPVPFGNQKQGTTSAASTITVTNNGTLNATLTAGTPVTITGTNPGDFAIATGTTCVASFVLTASGGSCVIKVTFTPGAAGARTATVNVADDAPANPQQTTLNGTGVLANVGVAPNPVPFGNQKQGTTSAASTITVTNSGTLNATLTAGTPVTITGTNPGDFAIATGTTCVASFVLTASGGSCVIKVTFTPGAAGARTATVNVADDGPGSPQQTTLNGTGVLANVGVAPNPVPFGNQKQGTTSAASTITVTNSGTLNATLTAGTPVTITGTNPGDFAIATGTTCVASFVLTANGGSCVIKVTFTPAAAGARTATVNVADDGPGSPQQTTLNGTGVLANVGVAPNPVPFGNQTLGTTSGASTITVTNSGNLAATLTAGTPVTITGTNPGDFAIATGTTCVASFVLTASGGSCVIKVTFTPGAAGARTATVNVADDGPGSPQQTTLNGTGVQSTVILNPAPVNFGNQQVATPSTAQTITVTNSGTLAATLAAGTPVTISGTNPGDFAIATGTTCVASFVLTANGGSCVINVTFTPAAGGARTATVNVADNAPSSPQSVNVQGTGVQAAAITSANTTTFTVGTLGTFTVTATGSPVPTLSEAGALPTGVLFTPATGVLTGTPAAGTGGTYPVTFTAHNGVGADATQSFTLTVNQAAAFTSQNSASFAVGTAGTFSVVATGFPTPTLSESGTLPNVVGFVDNGNGTGKLSGTPAAGTGGTYPITFTAHNGVGADATQNFTLAVDSLPSVTTNPLAQTVNNGGTATFTAAASGTPAPTVQWQVSVGGGAFSNVPNATSTTLTFAAAFSQNGNKYQAVFTNSVGTATTTAATLTVVAPDLTVAKTNAVNFTVGQNGTFTIKVTNNGTGPTTGTITVTDTLNANLTFVPAGSGGAGWACAATGQVVTCTSTGAIAPAGSSSFSLVVLVAPGAYPSVQNSAGVSDPNDGNPTGADKTSADTATVNNAPPLESSFSPSLGLVAGATSAQQITLTGAGFNSSTQVTLGSNPPLNTPLSGTANAAGTSLTVSVPAAELATANAGNLTITVTNPKNPNSNAGGGSVSNLTFPLVAFAAAQDPPGTIAVTAGTPATVKIDYTATAPLPAALTVTCTVPQSLTGATCAVNGGTIAAGATSGSATITINAIPTSSGSSTSTPWIGGRGPWSTYLLWLVAMVLLSMLGMVGAIRQRTLPLRRAPAYLTLVLLALAAGALVGCTTTAKTTPTPTGPSSITVTATAADGASVTTTVNITVSN